MVAKFACYHWQRHNSNLLHCNALQQWGYWYVRLQQVLYIPMNRLAVSTATVHCIPSVNESNMESCEYANWAKYNQHLIRLIGHTFNIIHTTKHTLKNTCITQHHVKKNTCWKRRSRHVNRRKFLPEYIDRRWLKLASISILLHPRIKVSRIS